MVFTHYSVVCMVFTRVVTLVEYQQRDLDQGSCVWQTLGQSTNLVDGPVRMSNDIEK